MPKLITQQATITDITPAEITLELCNQQSCGACSAKHICGQSKDGRHLTLVNDGAPRQVGDTVELAISRSMGFKAIILAYMIPVGMIIGVLLGLQTMTDEMTAGLVALGMLVVYFVILRIFRNRISSQITITIL